MQLRAGLVEDALEHKRPEFYRFPIDIIVNEHDELIQAIGGV
jgi:hypothetical protein